MKGDMKYLTTLAFIIVFMSVLFLVCSQKSEETAITVSCGDFIELGSGSTIRKEVKVVSGEPITVILCSNPTTGFQWELKKISEPSILSKMGNKYVAVDDREKVGAPGKEIWTFMALERGKSIVHMEYRRPWEKDKKAEWTFVLTVNAD